MSPTTGIVVSTVAAAAIVMLQFSHSKMIWPEGVVILGLAAAAFVTAHLRREASVEAVWLFAVQLALAAAMGVAALLAVCWGLSLLLISARYLFDLRVAPSLYEHIWTTGATLIGPLFALASVPLDVDQPFIAGANPAIIEHGVANVLNYVLAPLALAYALMLHIYAAKIAVTATMPKGQIGWMVTTFG